MVEPSYRADPGVLRASQFETLVDTEEALGEAAVRRHPHHGLSVSLDVHAFSVAVALSQAETLVTSVLRAYAIPAIDRSSRCRATYVAPPIRFAR
jgi:hypothetical protein